MASLQLQFPDCIYGYHGTYAMVHARRNDELKEFCRSEGLPLSGTKRVYVDRIITCLNESHISGDNARLVNLLDKIHRGKKMPTFPSSPQVATASFVGGAQSAYSGGYSHVNSNGTIEGSVLHPNKISFANTPFYTIKQPLTNPMDLPPRQTNRDTVAVDLILGEATVHRLRSEPDLKILVYCTNDPSPYSHPNLEIAFPGQVEIRVNEEPFAGNLRGVKKKPGTTRPADITALVRRSHPNYVNKVSISYAATSQRFYFIVNLAKKHPVKALVERVKHGQMISKQTVINQMITKSKDSDIVTTSTVMSLKCPLSAMRMSLPCRSYLCNHNQCFDAESFLQLQEQAPQWSCPTCNKVFNYENLVIDGYVQDILQSTPKSIEQVTIEPTGAWRAGAHESDPPMTTDSTKKKAPLPSWGSDDLIEISDFNPNGVKPEPISTPNPFHSSIPPFMSRETSTTASSAQRSTSSKRPAENVIDLTLSSDEDDDPPRRPVKRQSTASSNVINSNYNSYTGTSMTLGHLGQPSLRLPSYDSPAPGSGQAPQVPDFGRYWGS